MTGSVRAIDATDYAALLALHLGIGFVEVAQQETEAGTRAVSLLVRELAA